MRYRDRYISYFLSARLFMETCSLFMTFLTGVASRIMQNFFDFIIYLVDVQFKYVHDFIIFFLNNPQNNLIKKLFNYCCIKQSWVDSFVNKLASRDKLWYNLKYFFYLFYCGNEKCFFILLWIEILYFWNIGIWIIEVLLKMRNNK